MTHYEWQLRMARKAGLKKLTRLEDECPRYEPSCRLQLARLMKLDDTINGLDREHALYT